MELPTLDWRRVLALITTGGLVSISCVVPAAAQEVPDGPQPVKVVNLPGLLVLFGVVAAGSFVGVLAANLLWKAW